MILLKKQSSSLPSYNEAERLASDFIALLGEEKVHTFLGDDNPLAEFVFASQERQFARLEALNFLCQEDRQGILVTNVSGIKLLLPSPKVLHLVFSIEGWSRNRLNYSE